MAGRIMDGTDRCRQVRQLVGRGPGLDFRGYIEREKELS